MSQNDLQYLALFILPLLFVLTTLSKRLVQEVQIRCL